ncbi:uncharacterized protein [Venturia canescens]|uniref:uncharacterized protein n=1 Tax=Venturia canescens TaxID=32260 RepID=UPI001C9BE07C|nr:uncharacterized protein LOC122417826 [Venturia canescens]
MLKVKSYAGFFSVGADEDPNHLFFWYFPSKKDPVGAPVIAYIESAFGESSLFTLFAQNGPFSVNSDGSSLALREESWNNEHNVIYLDNAVGSGFSYTEKDTGYPRTMEQVGNRLCEALQQFLKLFPKLRGNDFYLAGETFGGKLIPEVAFHIHMHNHRAIVEEKAFRNTQTVSLSQPIEDKKIKLQGIVIANGFTHPKTQLMYAQYFRDTFPYLKLSDNLTEWETEMAYFFERKRYNETYYTAERFLKDETMQNIIANFTTMDFPFNFPWNSVPSDFIKKPLSPSIFKFIQDPTVVRALHVGDRPFKRHDSVLKNNLVHNITESHLFKLETLLFMYRVLILTGKKDLSCPHKFVVSYLSMLSGDVGDAYRDTKRFNWRDDEGKVVGSIVKAEGLTEMLLDNSGHLISVGNEKLVLGILELFINGTLRVVDKPLSVSSALERGGHYCALHKSDVIQSMMFHFESYAGYVNVNEKFNSNLFFWHVVAKNNPHTAPIIVHLPGALGTSSMFKMFNANGPVFIDLSDGSVSGRLSSVSWHEKYHLIYIDSPVGAGYSYTDFDEGYSKKDADVANDLLTALTQFFKLHRQLRNNSLFLVGDNYAGKLIPALGHSIHSYNEKANSSTRMNLKGMLIASGYVNPLEQLVYGEQLRHDGIITDECESEFITMETEVHDFIKKNEHEEAFEATQKFREKHNCSWGDYKSLDFPFNAIGPWDLRGYKKLTEFLNRSYIRRILHVGNRTFEDFSKRAFDHLKGDITRSQAGTLEKLLNHYRVLILNGKENRICPYKNVQNYVSKLKWAGVDEYEASSLQKYDKSSYEGELKKGGNLSFLVVKKRVGNWILENNQDLSVEILNDFVAGSL